MRNPLDSVRARVRCLLCLLGCAWVLPAVAAPPSAPVVTGTTSASTPVTLSWAAVSGATTYNVYRSTTAGGEGSTPLASGVSGTTYSDSSPTRGTTSYYTVTAVGSGGESSQSVEVPVDPVNTASPYYQINAAGPAVAPFAADTYYSSGNTGGAASTVDVTAVNAAPQTVYMRERNSASGWAIAYTLPGLTPGGAYVVRLHMAESYWSGAGQREFNVTVNGTTVLSQFDVFVAAGTNHKAVVRNFNATADASGNVTVGFSNGSADQLEINALEVLGGSVTSAPASLAATTSGTTASLTWGSVSGATSYNVYRGTAAGGEGSTPLATGVSGTAYTDSGLSTGTTYYYKVVAVDAQGESALSNEASATPLAPPTVTGTTSASTPVTLSWGAVTNATSYNVYRSAAPGGEGSTPLASGVSGTTYSDSSPTRGTTYYYTVAAVATGSQSAQSNEVAVDPVNTSSPYYQINVGGAAIAPFAADAYSNGVNPTSSLVAIDVTAVNAAPQTVYQYRRANGTIIYTFPGLTPSAAYVVRIHEADWVNTVPGQRQFNVAINGTQVLTNFDVIAAAGAPSKAVVRNLNATADGSGNITVTFSTGAVGNSMIEGLEILGGSVTAAPSLSAAEASPTSATLTWGAVSGATSYNLYRSTSAGTEGSTPYRTGLTGTSYTDSGLSTGTTYYYKVVAVDAQGESALSNEASATPLAPPTVTGTTSASTPVTLSWAAVSGATTYNVYRSTTAGGEGSTPLASGVSGTTYSDSSPTRGTTSYYTVTAVGSGGESSQSVEVPVDPVNTASPYYQINSGGPAVSPFAADAFYASAGTTVGSFGNTITVTVPNAAPAAVYQTDRDGSSPAMTYTLPGLTPGGAYVVRLHMAEKFYNSAGNRLFNVAVNGTTVLTGFEIFAATGAKNRALVRNFNAVADASGSITVVFTTNPNSPILDALEVLGGSVTSAPASLAETTSGTTAALTWGSVSGATGYNVYRGTTAGGEGSIPLATGVSGTSYSDSGLSTGTTYYYKVVAVDAQGESALSNEASATPLAPPTGVTATPGNAQVALSWTAASGATGYNVRRATTPGGPYTPLGTPTATSYTDSTAANNTTYFYVVQATSAAATSANSSEVAATPGGANGLLGWWKLDEDTGTTANDGSGFSNTGTFSGAAWATGRSGYAGSFNGTSGVIDAGKGVTATANSFSIACWVNMSSVSGYQTFISQDATSGSGYHLLIRGDTGKFSFFLPSSDGTLAGASANSITNPAVGVWVHLLGIYDAANGIVKLYVNGTLEGSQAFTTPWSATGHTVIGRGKYGGSPVNWVNGLIDDARVYNRVLSAAEIATISAYPTGVTATAANATATVSWSAFPSAVSYDLYRSTTPGTEGGTPYQTGLSGTSYNDTSVTNGTTYYYKVSAVTASGESAQSNEASAGPNAPPAAPTALTATPGNTRATLSWTAATGGGTITYTVLRSTTGGGPYTAVTGGSGLAGTTFTDPTGGAALTNGTVYYYVVTATNNGGTSGNSNQASVTPAVPALLLTKRITAINGVAITGFVTDGTGNDTNAYWPAPSSTYLRGATAATARPGDTVEYTLYFLAIGSGSVTSVVVSNVLPAHVTFAPASYTGLTPTDGGSGPSGLALASSASSYPTAPTVYLSNAADGDRGTFYAPGVAVSGVCTAAQNVSGVVVVNVVVSPTALPAATSAGSPYNSYGFVRYQVTIN